MVQRKQAGIAADLNGVISERMVVRLMVKLWVW